MKYRFLKLSMFSFTTYFLALPINADVVELHNHDGAGLDRIEQLTLNLENDASAYNRAHASASIFIVDETEQDVQLVKRSVNKDHKITYFPDYTSYFIDCHKKEFDNTKVCYLNANDIEVVFINGKYSVHVGSNHCPRSKAGLRIDNGTAIYGYEGEFSKPLSIIEKLKKGKFAYTRYQKWPYLSYIDKKTNLKDFTEKLNEMLKRYKEL